MQPVFYLLTLVSLSTFSLAQGPTRPVVGISIPLRVILIIPLFVTIPVFTHCQVIPDLLERDNFRPYIPESQKQASVQAEYVKKMQPKTSQELYPHLYRYHKRDHLNPIRGTQGDPANAFRDYTRDGIITATDYSILADAYNPNLTVDQRNMSVYEADLAALNAQRERAEKLVGLALSESGLINYSLGTHKGNKVAPFLRAYSTIQKMLIGNEKIDFTKAVFMVESAYDQTLTWKEFSSMFNSSKAIIERLLIQDGYSPDDNMAKIMSIFKYMADTTKVYFEEKEQPVITKPMLYDYDDYAGKKDASKIFVSKLLRTGTGQCMSLPMLYFLLAKALGVEGVHIALAPQHSYIKFKDKLGNWNNIELTGRMFTTDDFQWQGGFVKANQVKSGIYLKPLTDKETLSYLLTTLALTYVKTFGTDDTVYGMALTAKDHFPNSLTANSIIAGYYKDLFNHVLRQYSVFGLTQQRLDNDANAQAINKMRIEAYDHLIKDLGYAKIPDWAYKAWLKEVNELANKRQHIVKMRQLEQQLNR